MSKSRKPRSEAAKAVFGLAELSRPMLHRQFGHAKAAGVGQHRNEAVQFAVQPHFPGDFRPENLQSAIVIVQLESGERADQPVEDFAGIDFVPRIEPAFLPAVDDVRSR